MPTLLSKKLSVEDLKPEEVKDKKVLMRVDFNCPLNKQTKEVSDDTRIKAAIPTIERVMKMEPSTLVLVSHLGRPDGRVKPEFTLAPVAERLSNLLVERLGVAKADVLFVPDSKEMLDSVPKPYPPICLLENIRFSVEEEGKGVDEDGNKIKADSSSVESFRAKLSSFADIYINDAFGTAHRAHSSMVGVNCAVKASGLLMKKELEYFSKVTESPARPFLSILGGAKVADKIKLIENLLDKVDMMIIGGGMAYTFKKVLDGMKIGNSLFDEEGAKIVPDLMVKAKEKGVKILLPCDFKIANEFKNDASEIKTVTEEEGGIPDGFMGLDCGPKSIEMNKEMIMQAKTIVWNGPLGVFEMENFAKGSIQAVDDVIEATKNGTISIIGGGDTASLVENLGKAAEISHVSTGGGASLELLEGKDLPGVVALSDKE